MNILSDSLIDGGAGTEERVALVTGAREGGISYATTTRLLEAGYIVLTGDRDKDAGMQAFRRLRDEGHRKIWFCHMDFANEFQVGALMDRIRRKFGRLDLLVNTSGSAGNPLDDNLANLTTADLRQLFRDNVETFYTTTRSAVTQFMQHQKSGGVVIALSTNNGLLGIRSQIAYGALKQTLVSFCRGLTVAYGRRGIRFLVVTPGVVLTNSPNWQHRVATNPSWPEVEGSLNPTGRMVNPDDVAQIVLDVSSSRWQMVTGVEIVVDGGERAAGGDLFATLDVNDYRRSAVGLAQVLRSSNADSEAA